MQDIQNEGMSLGPLGFPEKKTTRFSPTFLRRLGKRAMKIFVNRKIHLKVILLQKLYHVECMRKVCVMMCDVEMIVNVDSFACIIRIFM